MTITRVLAVAAAAVCASATTAVGLAGPAAADQVMEGVYTYTQGDVVAEWTIFPSCVPTVGDLRENLQLPVACRLHVAPSSAVVAGGDARLVSNVWQFSTTSKNGVTCPDGKTKAPITETYEFDDITMTGTRSTSYADACDGQLAANLVKNPFTLAYRGPLPIPVQQYPLYCEPGGLKRCF